MWWGDNRRVPTAVQSISGKAHNQELSTKAIRKGSTLLSISTDLTVAKYTPPPASAAFSPQDVNLLPHGVASSSADKWALWAQDSELLQLWDYSFYTPSFNYGSFRLLTFRLMQFLFHVHVLVCHKKTKHGFFFFQKLQRTFSQVVSGITLQYHTWPVDRCGTIFWNKPWRGNFLYFHEPHCCYEEILYFYSYSSVPARPSWF